jgi:hypothetical protein
VLLCYCATVLLCYCATVLLCIVPPPGRLSAHHSLSSILCPTLFSLDVYCLLYCALYTLYIYLSYMPICVYAYVCVLYTIYYIGVLKGVQAVYISKHPLISSPHLITSSHPHIHSTHRCAERSTSGGHLRHQPLRLLLHTAEPVLHPHKGYVAAGSAGGRYGLQPQQQPQKHRYTGYIGYTGYWAPRRYRGYRVCFMCF